MKIGISCAFRHRPDEDGSLIPASRIEQAGPYEGRVLPILGYLCLALPGDQAFWAFVRYEAQEIWAPPHPCRRAQMGTCRAAAVSCPDCGRSGPFPMVRIPGDDDRRDGRQDRPRGRDGRDGHDGREGGRPERARCPICGSRNATSVPIRERSAEFDALVGDLREPLLQEARAALALPEEARIPFRFPMVLFGGPGVEPDPDVPGAVQGLATAHGRGFKLLEHCTFQELSAASPLTHDVSIVPEITSGVAEDAEVRAGRSRGAGAIDFWLKSWLPEPPPRPVQYGTFKY